MMIRKRSLELSDCGMFLHFDGKIIEIKRDAAGRAVVYLGRRHPLARKSGQQYVYRLVAMLCVGRRLAENEHVHHLDGDKSIDLPSNLSILLAEFHGRHHCALWKGSEIERGRPRLLSELAEEVRSNRRGAVIEVSHGAR